MAEKTDSDAWTAGRSYDVYMGRWSRKVAAVFLGWLAPPVDADWLEIGCGTGALTATILASSSPRSVLAIDPSAPFVAHAKKAVADGRVRFEVADAQRLPVEDRSVDVVASALALNFVPDRGAALAEMARVLRPGGLLSFYVWDYPGGGMGFVDAFWKAAAEVDPDAAARDEGARFPFCTRDGLARICEEAGIPDPIVAPIGVETEFEDFEAFWRPFTLGAGPAPAYCAGLPEETRERLRDRLAASLGTGGPIRFPARAWAVKASMPN